MIRDDWKLYKSSTNNNNKKGWSKRILILEDRNRRRGKHTSARSNWQVSTLTRGTIKWNHTGEIKEKTFLSIIVVKHCVKICKMKYDA